jgi:hypothetical protein
MMEAEQDRALVSGMSREEGEDALSRLLLNCLPLLSFLIALGDSLDRNSTVKWVISTSSTSKITLGQKTGVDIYKVKELIV